MKKYMETISKALIFRGLGEDEIEELLDCLGAKINVYAKGNYILYAGDTVQAAGLVLRGNVLIVQEDVWGNRNLMNRLMPGTLFAESFACRKEAVMTVSVLADEEAEILWLDVSKSLTIGDDACKHYSRFVQNLLAVLAEKNIEFSQKLNHMGKRTTREKLLSYLSSEAKRQGRTTFDIPFSRQQLADYLSVERSAMSAELGKLRKEGMMDFCKNHFVLHHTKMPEM